MNSTSLTVQELKKALKKRGLSERGLKKELVERLDAAVSREEEREGEGEEEETNRKRGTKRKNDDGEEEEEEDEKRRKTSALPAPAAPVLRRGRSRSKSVEPPPAASEEAKKNNDAKPPLSSSALEKIDEEGGEEEKKKNTTNNKAAAMKEKMQKAKELMKKQKALAEKMKMKKMEAAGAGAKTTTTTTTTSTSAAQHAIEKARETAARLAALQHQQKKNRTATEGKFEKTGPAPVLRVNDKGQEVDENGKVIVRAKDYTATTKVNEKQKMREAFLQAEREVAMEEMRRRGDAAGGKRVETTKEDMIDPEIAVKQKHNRKKPSLQVSRVYSSRALSFFSLFVLVGHMQGTLSYQSYITVT